MRGGGGGTGLGMAYSVKHFPREDSALTRGSSAATRSPCENTPATASWKAHSYSIANQRGPRARRSSSRKARSIRGHSVALTVIRCHFCVPVQALKNQPCRAKAVDRQ